jgi:uncharacterized DUF497 family protein
MPFRGTGQSQAADLPRAALFFGHHGVEPANMRQPFMALNTRIPQRRILITAKRKYRLGHLLGIEYLQTHQQPKIVGEFFVGTISQVEIEFDPAKSAKNERERGLPFTAVLDFVWKTAEIGPSRRRGEDRYIAVGYLHGQIHLVAYTMRGSALRVISLRRASEKEGEDYEKTRSLHD